MRKHKLCNRRQLVALIGLVAGVTSPGWASDSAVPVVRDDFDATLVPEQWDQPTIHLSWRRTPSATDISRAFPKRAIYSGAAEWQCGADASGHLEDCELVQTVPAGNAVQRDGIHIIDERYARAAKQLLPMFELDAQSTQAVRIEGNKVQILVPVAKPGAKPVPASRCEPPTCTVGGPPAVGP